MSNDFINEFLKNVDNVASPNINISDFLHIKEGKWEFDGHPFDGDPIYDTYREYGVEVSMPFLQDVTSNPPIDNLKGRVTTLPSLKMELEITYELKKNGGR